MSNYLRQKYGNHKKSFYISNKRLKYKYILCILCKFFLIN